MFLYSVQVLSPRGDPFPPDVHFLLQYNELLNPIVKSFKKKLETVNYTRIDL